VSTRNNIEVTPKLASDTFYAAVALIFVFAASSTAANRQRSTSMVAAFFIPLIQ
jgi:hypothetical protein